MSRNSFTSVLHSNCLGQKVKSASGFSIVRLGLIILLLKYLIWCDVGFLSQGNLAINLFWMINGFILKAVLSTSIVIAFSLMLLSARTLWVPEDVPTLFLFQAISLGSLLRMSSWLMDSFCSDLFFMQLCLMGFKALLLSVSVLSEGRNSCFSSTSRFFSVNSMKQSMVFLSLFISVQMVGLEGVTGQELVISMSGLSVRILMVRLFFLMVKLFLGSGASPLLSSYWIIKNNIRLFKFICRCYLNKNHTTFFTLLMYLYPHFSRQSTTQPIFTLHCLFCSSRRLIFWMIDSCWENIGCMDFRVSFCLSMIWLVSSTWISRLDWIPGMQLILALSQRISSWKYQSWLVMIQVVSLGVWDQNSLDFEGIGSGGSRSRRLIYQYDLVFFQRKFLVWKSLCSFSISTSTLLIFRSISISLFFNISSHLHIITSFLTLSKQLLFILNNNRIQDNMIDPDEVITSVNYPQALREALIHRRNTMVGNIGVENSKLQCSCCNKKMRKTQPINFNTEDMGFLGAGYPLYFMFNRMCLTILYALGILVNVNPYLYAGLNRVFHISRTIKQYQLLNIQVTIILTIIIYAFENSMMQTQLRIDETHSDPEDYSVWVRNLPLQLSQDGKLDRALKQYFRTQYSKQVIISSICLCYNLVPLGRFLSRKKEQLNCIKKYRSEKEKRVKIVNLLFNTTQLPYQGINQYHGVRRENGCSIEMGNFQEYSKEKLASIDQFINFSYHNSNIMFIGEAILSFQSVEMKTIVLNQSETAYFFGNRITIEQVSSPRDINWHNLHLEESDHMLRKIFSLVSCVALIFTTLSIKTFFSWLQLKTEDTRFESQILKSSTSGIIILMNMVMENFFLKHLSHYEGHRTKVKSLTMYAVKCIALQILTCLIVPYLAAYLIFQMNEPETYLEKIDDLIFGNAIVSLFLLAISHKTLIKSLQIKLFQLGGWRFIPKKILTVRELCSMYQLPEFEIEHRYSETVKNTFLTVCFFTMVPKALPYTIIHVFFVYYLDKYNLVRRRSVLMNVNGTMNRTMMNILILCIPVHLVAEMMYNSEISCIMLILLLLSILVSIRFKTKVRDGKKVDIASTMNYWGANCKFFHTDYRRENPALAGVAQAEFEQKVRELNLEMNLSQGDK